MKYPTSCKSLGAGTTLALALLCTFAANPVEAVPYASLIRFGEPVLAGLAINVDLNYVLNEDADTVTVEVYNNTTASVVRTYNFTSPDPETQLGSHTITWDGLDDGALPVVLGGNEFVINITVEKLDSTTTWTRITGNSSTLEQFDEVPRVTEKKTLGEAWFANSLHVPQDPTSTAFGRVLGLVSVAGNTGMSVLTTALDPEDGVDGMDLKGQHSAGTGNFALWHASFDPLDSDLLWWAGQTAPTGGGVTDVSGDSLDDMQLTADTSRAATSPRGVAVVLDGGDRVTYYANGNNIERTTVDQTYPFASIDTTVVGGVGTYAQKVLADDDGNLYFLTRVANNNRIFRWSAADVAAAPTPLLDASNAQWVVQFPATVGHVNDIAINPVDGWLYANVTSADATLRGMYRVGDTTQASLSANPLDMAASDVVLDYDDPANFADAHPHPYTLAAGLAFDWVGNVYIGVRLSKEIHSFSPAGDSVPSVITTSSPLTLTDDVLLISLQSFAARSAGVGFPVAIRWSTSSEIDNVGFHLNRVRFEGGTIVPAGRVNDTIIPGAGTSADGARYNYRDTLPLADGENRGYVLVDVDANGNTTKHGPFRVQVRPNDPAGEQDWMMY